MIVLLDSQITKATSLFEEKSANSESYEMFQELVILCHEIKQKFSTKDEIAKAKRLEEARIARVGK